MNSLYKAALLSLLSTCLFGVSFAADTVKIDNEKGQLVTIHGSVHEYEGANIYKIIDENQKITRVDLGKYGGRLLIKTPFAINGNWSKDEVGELFVMKTVDYKDPDPYAEYFAALEALKHPQKSGLELKQIRDLAFDHENPVSDDSIIYTNNVAKLSPEELKQYSPIQLEDLSRYAAGDKVVFLGRAIETVVDREVMLFWDLKGHPINVVMNGAYAPLGQRCNLYGTLVKDSADKLVLHLEYMDSIAIPYNYK